MARVSMSDVWDETVRFVGREKRLLLPLGFATFGVALLLIGLATPADAAVQIRPGAWMVWLVPGFLLVTMGYLSMSAMVLLPNISVREALGVARARLLPAVALSAMLIGAILLILMIATLIAGVLGAGLGWSMQRAAMASVLFALVPLLWLSTRLVTLWPLLVDRGPGLIETVGRSFALTAGHAARIFGVILLAGAAYLLLTGVAQLVGGSLFILIGRALGNPGLPHVLTSILLAAVGAVLSTVWGVFVAMLYRRLAGSRRGT